MREREERREERERGERKRETTKERKKTYGTALKRKEEKRRNQPTCRFR